MMEKKKVNTNLVVIKDAGLNIEVERGCITHCDETPDGVNFQLATGMQLFHTNHNMSAEMKFAIVNAVKKFDQAKKTVINMRDYKKPIAIINN